MCLSHGEAHGKIALPHLCRTSMFMATLVLNQPDRHWKRLVALGLASPMSSLLLRVATDFKVSKTRLSSRSLPINTPNHLVCSGGIQAILSPASLKPSLQEVSLSINMMSSYVHFKPLVSVLVSTCKSCKHYFDSMFILLFQYLYGYGPRKLKLATRSTSQAATMVAAKSCVGSWLHTVDLWLFTFAKDHT